MLEDLFRVLHAIGVEDARDRALLLIGFSGGFRRSEIGPSIATTSSAFGKGSSSPSGARRPTRKGRDAKVGVPFGRTRHCPVLALDRWLAVSGIEAGPVFRPVDRHGRVASERLSGEAVSMIVKEPVAAAGIDPTGFSGHSLRAGFATSAVKAGA